MVLPACCLALCFPLCLGLFGSSKSDPTNQLRIAVERGDLDGAKAALQHGALVEGGKPEVAAEYGFKETTPLAAACLNKDIPMIELLLANGADVNSRSGPLAGVLPLENAITASGQEQNAFATDELLQRGAQHRLEVVQLLISKGADPKRHSRIGSCPLAIAASDGTPEIVSFLLEKGAPANGKGQLDQPLAEVAHRPRDVAARIAEILIEHGAKVDNPIPPNLDTPLGIAATFGNTPVVQVLLNHQASVSAANRFGSTPLHLAADGKRLPIIKLLLEHGANRDAKDKKGRKPADRTSSESVKAALTK